VALLSQQLKNIANNVQAAQQTQAGVGQAANMFQTQQALTQLSQKPQPGAGAADATALAQQLAPAITQEQAKVDIQAQQQAGQQILQAGQSAAQQQEAQAKQRLEQQRLATEREIAEKQLEGKLKQNSLELEQSKRLQTREINQQKRFQQTGFEYNDRISFLTRKQREDLASMGAFMKQQIFDSRLQFSIKEGKRKFSNERQLADYAILSAQNEIKLNEHLRSMQQAHDKEMILLEAAYNKLVQQRKQEFAKQEQDRDQALVRDLTIKRNAIRAKMRRKQANRAMWTNSIKGVVIISAAVAVTVAAPAAAPAAATAAQAAMASYAAGEASDVVTAGAAEGGAFD
jgi:hypothetical protein